MKEIEELRKLFNEYCYDPELFYRGKRFVYDDIAGIIDKIEQKSNWKNSEEIKPMACEQVHVWDSKEDVNYLATMSDDSPPVWQMTVDLIPIEHPVEGTFWTYLLEPPEMKK